MKIISWNVNGLRAVHNKGIFLDWLRGSDADIVCLQEIKAQAEKIPKELINPFGYFSYFSPAQRPGYAGTAIYSKIKPNRIICKLGHQRFDSEGRILELKFDNFTLINLYMVQGGYDKQNLEYKLETYEVLLGYLKNKKSTILTGDFNIAHNPIDLARPKENQDRTGFLPEERDKISKLTKSFVDTFRFLHPRTIRYSYWDYKTRARERDVGWRIDYFFASKDLKIESAFIKSAIMGSDHCPIGIDADL